MEWSSRNSYLVAKNKAHNHVKRDFIFASTISPELRNTAPGEALSQYHLEAAIAYWHTQKTDTRGKWEAIIQLCDRPLLMKNSPIAALNWAIAGPFRKGLPSNTGKLP